MSGPRYRRTGLGRGIESLIPTAPPALLDAEGFDLDDVDDDDAIDDEAAPYAPKSAVALAVDEEDV